MADILAGVGSAIGSLFGGLGSLASTQAGVSAVGDLTSQGMAQVAPYNFTGANYLAPTGANLLGSGTGGTQIGNARVNDPSSFDPNTFSNPNPVDFEDFAKNYNTSEGAQYLMQTAQATQDSSAASKGQLLSGSNLRAQTTQQMGIANQDLTQQYQQMLAGQQQGYQQYQAADQQDFQQRETSYQNMYGQEAMGLQAGIGEAGTAAQGARAIGSLYSTQAQQASASGNSFGSALSNVFSGIANAFK